MNKLKTFSKKQNIILSEIYRRLNHFNHINIDSNLIVPLFPSEAKIIEKYKLIETSDGRIATPRIESWYKLTDDGKYFFKNYLLEEKISPEENLKMCFYGKYITFYKHHLKNNQ